MPLHPGSTELLSAVPRVLEGTTVRVLAADGTQTARFGAGPLANAANSADVRVELPRGAVIASCPAESGPVRELVQALLDAVADRERLEEDMESMSTSSLRLLEQVSMFGETLPRLSAGGTDAEIASQGVRACQRAAAVQQVLYLGHLPAKAACEVVVHFVGDGARSGEQANLDSLHPVAGGLLAEVLAVEEGVVLRRVPAARRIGEPGSPEHLAVHSILGVPVTYGAGDKRVLLGALLLIDKQVSSYDSARQLSHEERQLGNEEGQIAESFAAMLGAVLGARKTAEFGKELHMAQAIQRQILPERSIALGGFDIAARYHACGAVGGDYFDYVPLADGRTMVVVADVSGHNLASGMMMVSARAMLRTLASVRAQPSRVFEDLAATMFEDLTRTERFLTAAAVALSSDQGAVEYVSAGHNDLLVYRAATDRVVGVVSESTILGFLKNPEYPSRRIELSPGDCMLLFTDGITEAMDETGQMFGDERLAALFAQLAQRRTAQGIVDGIVHELDAFRRGQVGTDDVTAVVIRCTGRER